MSEVRSINESPPPSKIIRLPSLSIVCYLSCHSNILLQTVLTNKLQKSRQIDRYSVSPVARGGGNSSSEDVLCGHVKNLVSSTVDILSFRSVLIKLQMIFLVAHRKRHRNTSMVGREALQIKSEGINPAESNIM